MASSSTFLFVLLAVVVAVNAYKKTPECYYCKHDYECQSDFCHKNKCVWRNKSSVEKCFVKLCGYCKHDYECITNRCFKHKCVPKLRPYTRTCFPYYKKPTPSPTPTSSPIPKYPDCKRCKHYYQCSSGYCTNGYCGNPYAVYWCPKPECSACDYNSQCTTKWCKEGICIKSYRSFVTCRKW